MVSVPNPRTWIHREIPPYDTIATEIVDTVSFLLNPPMIKVHQTSAQSVPDSTWTAVSWNVEDIDPYNFHSTTTNPTRVTPTVAGWYRGWYSFGFVEGTTTDTSRSGYIAKNGVETRSRHNARPHAVSTQSRAPRGVPFYIDLNGTTDYVELFVYQDTALVKPLQSTAAYWPELFLRWWGVL